MNETHTSAVALAACALVPLVAGCAAHGGASNAQSPALASSAPPAGYGGAAPPPGYPGTYVPAQGGPYPAAQPAYSAPAAAPPPAGGTYATGPAYPSSTAQSGSPAPPTPASTSGAPAPGGSALPGPLAPADPNSLQAILAGVQSALLGTLVTPGTSGDVTEAGLKAQALKLAPGMQPDGSELKQNLSEGQHAVVMVTMQAGKCYTILGFSPAGAVTELDLNLLAPPLWITLAGQSLTHSNAPAIGASHNPMCPIIAFPLQYKLDVFAKSGNGPVAVQLYSKPKT